MIYLQFSTAVGYILGILIAFVVARIFFKPFKFILKILLNSIIAFFILLVINKFFPYTGIFIGANPLTAVTLGIFGIPGLCLLLLLQILF